MRDYLLIRFCDVIYYVSSCCFRVDFYSAMRCKRGLCCHAVSVRLSVCLSVTFVDHVKTNKDIFEFFSPWDSDTILVFQSQRKCRYSDGNDDFFSQISRCISEMVIDRLAHAAIQFVSIAFSFHPYNI